MIRWTEHQRHAVEARDCSLAVSAAAGSGKTRVLTGRIISLLSEGTVKASRLAVVTYTKAAAKGLEDRLYEELSKMVAENPENTTLSRQLMNLSRAQISTIHSFCYALLRAHGKALGLTGKERIADPLRLEPLKDRAIREAVTAFLADAGEKTETRRSLCRVFGTARDLNGLYDALARLFETVSYLPGGLEELKSRLNELEEECDRVENASLPFAESSFGRPVAKEAEDRFLCGAGELDAVLGPLSKTQVLGDKYIPFMEERKRLLEDCAALCRGSDFFGAAKALKDGTEKSLPSISKKTCPPDELELKERIAAVHNNLKKSLLAFSADLLCRPLPSLLSELRRSLSLSREFLILAQDALDRYAAFKKKKNILDYADLEQMTLRLVARKKDGKWVKTPVGERITGELDAVFVDEYQDSNGIQDRIFRSVTREDNLFIVGDPKQSIYRFRGAEPEIFSDYKNDLPVYTEGATCGMRTVFLSDNFRCAKPIIDLVNRTFRIIMSGHRPDSLYGPDDELRYAKKPKEGETLPPAPNTELVLISPKKEEEETERPLTEAEILLRDENTEAGYIATRIHGMLGEYKPEQIAVLCRTNLQIPPVRSALQKLDIPCTLGAGSALADEPEFLFVTSLLGALDNPRDDVALLGTMLSPVFRFDADSLYRIRLGRKKCFYYEALRHTAREGEEPERSRAKALLDTLSLLREQSKTLTLPALIFSLYRSLSISELFGNKDGSVKEFFLGGAESAESAEETSLSDFIAYIKRAAEENTGASEGAPGVKLMTIHKSKGLEFPVVFASFMAKKFDVRDESAKLILSPSFGPCFHLPEDGGRVKVNTFLRKAAALKMHEAMVEEEMRVLYVALTRAETKLIVTAKPQNFASLDRDLLLCNEEALKPELTERLLRGAPNLLTLLLLSLRDCPALRCALEQGGTHTDGSLTVSVDRPLPIAAREEDEQKKEENLRDPKEILDALAFTYEEEALSRLPKKLSVSQLLRAGREEEAGLCPRRLSDLSRQGLKRSAAEIGTATHSVMQFASLSNLEENLDAELERLVQKGFLTEEDADLVEKKHLAAFLASPLYARMKASSNVVREKRFNVLLPAKELLGSEGKVLVQGVIDAWFEEADGTVTVVDFKTDRVKEADGEEILLKRHSEQLHLYALAVEQLTEKKVGKKLIYSFCLGRAIEVKS
ncbi:MAG: UvrD-helicase domain-containing protein [Clostridia bacterium]|nr:UvrD-helicase domain-containing protein [Clostridia bacterium]